MARLGIVDLGSNTARLVVFQYEPGSWFQILDGIREPVRLGERLGRGHELTPQAIDRGLAALRLFGDYARTTELDRLEVIGTSALRDARNSVEFMRRIRELEVEVSVLTGEEEAQLGVAAVANSFAFPHAWVADLGGGSVQVSVMRDRLYESGRAFPLGSLRMKEAHPLSDPPRKREVRQIERTVAAELTGVARRIASRDWPIVAMGGAVRNLARASQERRKDVLGILHGFRFSREALEEITGLLLGMTEAERAAVPGLNPDRADLIVHAALIFRWLLASTGRDELLISGQGVREGVFYRRFLPPPHLIEDVRRFSVENLQRQWGQSLPHVDRVVELADRLFVELQPLHGLGEASRGLLEAAGRLHDIGMAVDYNRHHKHGAYLARSLPLPGYSRREQALIALLVRYHRKGLPRLGRFRRLAERGDARRLQQLAACLRLAEQLERSRSGRVTGVSATIGRKRVRIEVAAREEPTVELWEASKHADLFERAFSLPLDLRAVSPPDEPPPARRS
ncbi:MAG: Ppx/GppA phosphatase family protein [Thermoanaerobaculia bacterium]|nr:Ppx/GppA phosphatase family protein [Thermoanaerobaculia bacterium]